jgi:hypothetical protein
MDSWMPFFVAVTAVAVVFQAIILAAIFFWVRNVSKRIEETTVEVRSRVAPILGRVQMIVDDVHPQITNMVTDAAQITQMARSQVQHADRVLSEALERLRMQLAHTDQILTGALEAVEEAGTTIRRTILGPVQSLSAIIRGVQAGLDFFRGTRSGSGRRRDDVPSPAETQDESLFI